MAFATERRKRSPAPLVVLVDLEHGNASVEVDTFETAWTPNTVYGTPDGVRATTDTAIKTKGDRSNKWQFFRGHNMDNTQAMDNSSYMSVSHLSVLGRTPSPAANLSAKNSVTVQVRSDVTGPLLRFGLGEVTSTFYQQDLLSIATANQWVQKVIDLSNVADADKNAVARLRFQFLGSTGGLGRNVTMYLDELASTDFKRYANRAVRFRGPTIPPLAVDDFDAAWTSAAPYGTPDFVVASLDQTTKVQGAAANKWQFFRGHTMDNTQAMDNSVSMAMSVNSVLGRTPAAAIDLNDRNFLFVRVYSDATGSLLRFGMGEATSTTFTKDLSIPSANVWKDLSIDISSVGPANKDAIARLRFQFLGSTGGLGRTVTMRVDDLVASRYGDRGSVSYKVYSPKLLGMGAIGHALRSSEARGRLASLGMSLANTDGEFYALRDTDIMLNRRGIARVGFDGDAETEYQTVFDGKIQDEELTDERYAITLEENLSKFYRDVPFTPLSLTAYPNAATADVGRMLPLAIGRCRAVPPLRVSVPSSIYLYNDSAYGRTKAVKAVRIGARTVGAASYTVNSTGGTLTLTFATASGLALDVDGYRDDADGTYTGTATALIENPSDVYRFLLKKVLGMTVDEVDEPSLDTARTTWAGYRATRYLNERRSSFQLLTSGGEDAGLAEAIHGYFYTDNQTGKARLIAQARDTAGATSGNYHETGANANILERSYRRRTVPRNLVNDVEVAYAYGAASGLYKDLVKRRDTGSQNSVSGYGKAETVRIGARWLPADLNGLTLQYVGTAGSATVTVTGEDDDTTLALRTTTPHSGENLNLSFTNTSYNTLQKLVNYIDGLSAYTASLPTSANGGLDSRGMRDVTARDIKTSTRTMAFSFGKLLAAQTVERYRANHDEVRWRTSLVGFTQRLGDVVTVQTVGERASRRVRVYGTQRQPLEGTVEIIGEIE